MSLAEEHFKGCAESVITPFLCYCKISVKEGRFLNVFNCTRYLVQLEQWNKKKMFSEEKLKVFGTYQKHFKYI